ncbi:MAG TPA: UvrD-helicase domain-containing protein [Planctomycetota bacterium]|nr:UvrD-helicase domain-containing protein [Planctomycetota bacterium]
MGFYADLHVHSKHSRATSRDADLEHMAHWARRKGVTVLGTGDFTHPVWLREIEEKLVPAEPGLFRLRPDLQAQVDAMPGAAPGSAGGASLAGEATRFLLEVEISTIYKKGDRTRKVHHCIYVPDLEAAKRLIAALSRIGNLASDGRPILGLDSRDLLEITLEAGEGSYLIPAHIWTPWFAALGSKSGFDSIEDCYGDLAGEIFAVETGLSSDPPMNRRLSRLDRFTLVSSSDAHSPPKIGREACVFECDMDYFSMRRALQTGERYGGTVEFFAEEGKYHLDGHRECGVCWRPEETRERGGACSVCGKPVTLGVLHRIGELADRTAAAAPKPDAPFRSLVPLEEVLSELESVGPQSKSVRSAYDRLLHRVGPELYVLEKAPLEDVARGAPGPLAEALSRMRDGRVIRQGGFDGQYGVIRLFATGELDGKSQSRWLIDIVAPTAATTTPPRPPAASESLASAQPRSSTQPPLPELPAEHAAANREEAHPTGEILAGLDPEQRAAAEAVDGPVLIVAGPGAGKTRTLTRRIACLIAAGKARPEECLAITFTRRAARELRERLEPLLPGGAAGVTVATFHGLGLAILEENAARVGIPSPVRVAVGAERERICSSALGISGTRLRRLLERVSRWKREGTAGEMDTELAAAARACEAALRAEGRLEFDELVLLAVQLLEQDGGLRDAYRARYPQVSVDEAQDMDGVQQKLVRLLVPPDGGNLCAIGDPDQSIYGFRGADPLCFDRLRKDYAGAREFSLARNYRSGHAIVEASLQLIEPATRVAARRADAAGVGAERIEIHHLASDRAEADFVAREIEKRIGGSAFFSIDTGRASRNAPRSLSFADFAVLYRTDAQADAIATALDHAGLPYERHGSGPLAEAPAARAVLQALEELDGSSGHGEVSVEAVRRAVELARAAEPAALIAAPFLEELARRAGGDRERFLSAVALATDADLHDPRAERIALLTLHAAKGLEFPVVFIVGLEDGIVPLRWGASDESDLAEERRLLFVGMTRARGELILTRARRRAWRGKVLDCAPSPFLEDIEARLVALDLHPEAARRESGITYRQTTLFEGA